jgi:hypothetical protein
VRSAKPEMLVDAATFGCFPAHFTVIQIPTLDSPLSSGSLKITSGGPSDCVNYGKVGEI